MEMVPVDSRNLANSDSNVVNTPEYAQYYQIVTNSLNPVDAVGKPLVHISALQQTTGNFF